MYLEYKPSASSLETLIPIVESIFCIFSFFTFSFCIGLSVWEVKAKIDAMPITITPTKRKVYILEFLSIKPFLILS